jgi:hypothetical protein
MDSLMSSSVVHNSLANLSAIGMKSVMGGAREPSPAQAAWLEVLN